MTARISSFCSGGECVTVELTRGGNVRVSSTRPAAARRSVTYTPEEWGAFLLGVKNAEFDLKSL